LSNALLIFFGAGIGGLLRFYLSNLVFLFLPRDFPYGTLFVNVSGSFLMGILFIFIFDRFNEISQPLRALLLIGFLGGYTTFSSFSIETIQLLESGEWLKVYANIFFSVTLCLTATWIGVVLGRQL
jgi:CrcB protein